MNVRPLMQSEIVELATESDAMMYAKEGGVIEWSLDLLVGSDGRVEL